MKVTGRDIICLSTHFWDDRWFRKQHFMSRFAERNRVLYVEPTFSLARRRPEHMRGLATNRLVRPRVERRGESVTLLKPPRGLPKWQAPSVERIVYRRFSRLIAETAEELGFRETILWVYRPAYWHGLDAIPHERLIFDLVDDIAAYPGARSPNTEACVEGLVRRSDLTVVTAKSLGDRYGAAARRIAHIPNGFDTALFGDRVEAVPALADVPKPIVGFAGTLFSFLDFELLHDVARTNPDKSMVLVGRVDPAVAAALDRLTALDNVWHLGPRPQASVPELLAAFDVCLCPFGRGEVADGVSPLKVYEYLAMGKPVVSTPMAGLEAEPIAEAIEFAERGPEFTRAIQRCLDADTPAERAKRRSAVAPYSWDRLFEQLDRRCVEAIG